MLKKKHLSCFKVSMATNKTRKRTNAIIIGRYICLYILILVHRMDKRSYPCTMVNVCNSASILNNTRNCKKNYLFPVS